MKGKGQAMIGDFAVSMALFGVILGAFFIPWNTMIETDQRFSSSETMKTQAERTAAVMITSSGYPENWEEDTSDLVIPGFSQQRDNLVSKEKLEAFAGLSYEEKRSILNVQDFSLKFLDSGTSELLNHDQRNYLGRGPVAYIVPSSTSFSSLEALDNLNSSGKRWDLYFPSEEDENFDSLTAEKVYTNNGDAGSMMEGLISNISEEGYGTIIAENVQVSAGSVDNTNDLRTEVEGGLTYVHSSENYEFLLEVFDMDEASDGGNPGEVVNQGPLISSDFEVGDSITFENVPEPFTNVDEVFVSSQGAEACLACREDIGEGKVYFLADMRISSGDGLFSNTSKSMARENTYTGNIYDLGGNVTSDAETVVTVDRRVIVNKSGGFENAEMKYVVWR